MPTSNTNETIIQPNPYAGGQPAPPISMPGQVSQPAPGGSPSNNSQGPGQNTIVIDDEVSLSGPSTGLNGTPQQTGPSPGGNVQPTTPGTDFNNVVVGMAPGSNGAGQNQSSGSSNGWSRNGDNWYYIDPSTGKMVKGWKKIDGYWYYLDSVKGVMATGWIILKDLYYYLNPNNGRMETGWQRIDGAWYYLETHNDDGQMVTGWKLHNGEWYYLYNTGVMAHGGWLLIDDKWYCFRNDSGALECGKVLDYDGKKYYVNDDGVMVTRSECETVEYRGVIYEVDWDGVCTPNSSSSGAAPANATNANIDEWRIYIANSDISIARKTILLKSFETIESGCIYHQLRGTSANETPSRCLVPDGECNAKTHPKHDQIGDYSFSTMAKHNLETPLYLDCSYFVKHCYWKAGKNMSSSNTTGMRADYDFVDIPQTELLPADIAIKPGHVKMFVGYTSNGAMVWSEMKNHAKNGVVSAHSLSSTYILRRYKDGLDE